MSCPDWTSLTAHRRDKRSPEPPEPEAWSEALAHFDGGCKVCRKAALKSDPTLVFRHLPAASAAAMTEAQERAEVDAVRQAVAGMRAASRLDSLETRKRAALLGGWRRWSAAAALTMMAVTIPSDDTRQVRRQAAIFRDGLMAEQVAWQTAPAAPDTPVLEGGVDLPDARVYHQSYDGLSVVMVVDESLEI